MQMKHPQKLHEFIVKNNAAIFDAFLDFPKPLIVAANGPAIGACVTSATLCDAIIASEKATFSTPFAKLGIVPEVNISMQGRPPRKSERGPYAVVDKRCDETTLLLKTYNSGPKHPVIVTLSLFHRIWTLALRKYYSVTFSPSLDPSTQ